MSAQSVVLVLSTLLLVGGIALATTPAAHHRSARPRLDRGDGHRMLIGLSAGLAVVASSGWLLPALVVAVAAWWLSGAWSVGSDRGAGVERTDALASWIEHLRDVLLAGDQPIGAIRATVATAPAEIRPAVRHLAAALGHQDPRIAFARFADELDDPVGDLVAAGLLVAVQRGARTVAVLTALAEQARTQADRRRVVEAERAPLRREVALLSAIMAALVVGVIVFGRADYLAPYATAQGQTVLAAVLAAYAALLMRVRRLARFPRPARFLGGVVTTQPTVGVR